ncbi:uncharacterized protein B0P05DRAFT_565681 [Gilbertella persicaria]|uniref:uncharacterized protein n=1 Tax=Gilbertella persicaria TaxID=101096 RepID=UPI00221F86E8|nr:uncharacterized protein B0P05DRAFT_565681 [Gilbertella persicaria]KAI8047581.1 hypothetical protein B0P05DRAFT_565681 [Gilbertella persicaria]
MKAFVLLLLFISRILLVHSLPVFSSSSIIAITTESVQNSSPDKDMTSVDKTQTSLPTNSSNSCPDTDFSIPVERFAQLVSTHWQFDHLDSIKSGTYRIISEEFQKHIRISIEEIKNPSEEQQQRASNIRQKSFGMMAASAWDMMDLEILHAQIFGAIQAHTEGSLHIAWDRLADKLGQPAFDSFIRDASLRHCSSEDGDGLLSSNCLKDNASQLSRELDDYIYQNLMQFFTALDQDVLPKMLANTSKDLSDVLNYFNRLFSSGDRQQLYLHVTPWMQEVDYLKSKLLPLLDKSTLIDDHLFEFFSSYACLSRA